MILFFTMEEMKSISDYVEEIAVISRSKKFSESSNEQKLLGLYNGISAFSTSLTRDEKEKNKRFGAIFVNLLSIANGLGIDAEKALSDRIKEIEECH